MERVEGLSQVVGGGRWNSPFSVHFRLLGGAVRILLVVPLYGFNEVLFVEIASCRMSN